MVKILSVNQVYTQLPANRALLGKRLFDFRTRDVISPISQNIH